MEKYGLIRGSQRTGKIDKAMIGLSSAMLKMWALQNTTPTKATYVFSLETGGVVLVVTGMKGRNYPKLKIEPDLNIEDICPGICIALNEEDADND